MSEENCTCNDEFITAPCPIHQAPEYKPFQTQAVLIDDTMILSTNPVNIITHRFKCAACGEPALISASKYCQNCGVSVSIQSKIVTDYIREIYNKRS